MTHHAVSGASSASAGGSVRYGGGRRNSDDATSSSTSSFGFQRNGAGVDAAQRRDTAKRRQVALNKRRAWQSRADVVDLHATNDHELAIEVQKMYEEFLLQKTPFDAYYSIVTSVRKFFGKETWTDAVDMTMRNFMRSHVLKTASKLATKYLQIATDVPLNRKIDDYQLQSLLHIHSLTLNEDEKTLDEQTLETIASLMSMISLISDVEKLRNFFDDIFFNFLDSVPRHLTRLYEELNQPLPSELQQYASEESAEMSFYEPLVVPSPSKANRQTCRDPVRGTQAFSALPDDHFDSGDASMMSLLSTSQTSRSFKCSRNFLNNKHHRMIAISASGSKKLKIAENSNAVDYTEQFKKMRRPLRCALNFASIDAPTITRSKKVIRTPKGKGGVNGRTAIKLAPETPRFFQNSISERRPKEYQNRRLIVNETPPRFWAKLPVRQSPRQHASTRALYGCAPLPASRLVPRAAMDGDESDVESVEHMAGFHSPNFVNIKLASAAKSSTKSKSSRLALLNDRDKTPSASSKGGAASVFGDVVPATDAKLRKTAASPGKKFKKNLSQTFSNDESSNLSNFSFMAASICCDSPKNKLNVSFMNDYVDKSSPRPSRAVNFSAIASSPPSSTKQAKTNFTASSPPSNNAAPSSSSNCSNSNLNGTLVHKTKNSLITASWNNCSRQNARSMTSSQNAKTNCAMSSSYPSDPSSFVCYSVPEFAGKNYVEHMNDMKRERVKPGDDLFYARDSVRRSVYCQSGVSPAPSSSSISPTTKQRTPSVVAPKNRGGRKSLLTSPSNAVHFIHSANFLLNAQNENLLNLRKTLATPIKLNKKLRAAPKNSRRRRRFFNGVGSMTSLTELKAETADSLSSPIKADRL